MGFEWEEIYCAEDSMENVFTLTYRAKVFGGWIVRNIVLLAIDHVDNPNTDYWERANISMVFVPDPKHEWEISEDTDD